MATLEQIVEGLIAFRDTTYAKLDALTVKVDSLTMNAFRMCALCQGTGIFNYPPGTPGAPPEPASCPQCSGTGKVLVNTLER